MLHPLLLLLLLFHMHTSKQFAYVVFITALFQEVRAVRDLQEGDEITANYVDRWNFTSKVLAFLSTLTFTSLSTRLTENSLPIEISFFGRDQKSLAPISVIFGGRSVSPHINHFQL